RKTRKARRVRTARRTTTRNKTVVHSRWATAGQRNGPLPRRQPRNSQAFPTGVHNNPRATPHVVHSAVHRPGLTTPHVVPSLGRDESPGTGRSHYRGRGTTCPWEPLARPPGSPPGGSAFSA